MGLLNDDREALFGVPGQGQILLTETQRSPYTSFVTLVGLDRAEWLQVPQLDVRMYHDARMAEIASIDGYRPVAGSHCRSSRERHADEKQQINTYLGEWLRYCLNVGQLRFGSSDDPISLVVWLHCTVGLWCFAVQPAEPWQQPDPSKFLWLGRLDSSDRRGADLCRPATRFFGRTGPICGWCRPVLC